MTWKPYGIEWAPSARQALKRLDRPLVERLVEAVSRYAQTGQGSIKHLQGMGAEWRLRVGEWRVRFTIDGDRRLIVVLHVAPRGGAYR